MKKSLIGRWVTALVFLVLLASLLWPVLHGRSPIALGLDLSGGTLATYRPDFSTALATYADATPAELLALAKETLVSRLHRKLSTVPDVVVRGDERIVVSVPAHQEDRRVLDLVGRTYHLTWRLVLENEGKGVGTPYTYRGDTVRLAPALFSGDMLDERRVRVETVPTHSELLATPQVSFRFRPPHDARFAELTGDNVGQRLAILLDDEVEWIGVIESAIAGTGVLSGSRTLEEARDLAMLLRAGTMPLSLELESLEAVGPSLGEEMRELGAAALAVTLALLAALVALAYLSRPRLLLVGLASLGTLLLLLLGAVSIFGLTLDIVGIAAVVLAVGMGMDAFILVFEALAARRRSPEAGSARHRTRRATSLRGEGRVLVHANATTLVVISLLLATERLRSFAHFTFVGMGASILTIFFTRALLLRLGDQGAAGWDPLERLRRGRPRLFRLRWAYALLLLAGLTVAALGLAGGRGPELAFGPDFRPGVQLVVEAPEEAPVRRALERLAERSPGLATSLQSLGDPAGGRFVVVLGEALASGAASGELREVFEAEGASVRSLASIDSRVSGRRTVASLSVLGLSFLCLAVYFLVLEGPLDRLLGAVRGRPTPARWLVFLGILAAVVIDLLAVLAVLAWLRVPIGLPVVAGLLTIVGYSVNDSVVLWSHVRRRHEEEPQMPPRQLVTATVDRILTRALLTSLSTLAPAMTILAVGLAPLAGFAWVIVVGTVAGTLSSLFVVGAFAVKALEMGALRSASSPAGHPVAPVASPQDLGTM